MLQPKNKITKGRLNKVADSLNTVGTQKVQAGVARTVGDKGNDNIARQLVESGNKDLAAAKKYKSVLGLK